MVSNIIILGGTGDLAKKMLFPALHQLFLKGKLDNCNLIGVGRRFDSEDAYYQALKEHSSDEKWDEFKGKISYAKVDLKEEKGYEELKKEIGEGKRIFYLAVGSEYFETITESLCEHGLVRRDDRICYEKPFGQDLKSAKKLNSVILKHLDEEQVYRVDHYLDKELVGNMSVMRFTNAMLEPVWNSNHIDHIQIVMSEDFGVEGRGGFYDMYGAVKDVFQNHLLQMLALTTMEEPSQYEAKKIRDEKVKVLKKMKIVDAITGQYNGYLDEEGVGKGSKTETFAAMKLCIKNKRWKGVPIYLMSGKNLEKTKAGIYVEFKNAACRLFEGVCPLEKNSFVVSLKPESSVYMVVNTKTPGETSLTTNRLEFSHDDDAPSAYENVFMEAVRGNQTAFVRSDEIEEQWRIVETKLPEPFVYEKGRLPQQAKEFIQKDSRSWHL